MWLEIEHYRADLILREVTDGLAGLSLNGLQLGLPRAAVSCVLLNVEHTEFLAAFAQEDPKPLITPELLLRGRTVATVPQGVGQIASDGQKCELHLRRSNKNPIIAISVIRTS